MVSEVKKSAAKGDGVGDWREQIFNIVEPFSKKHRASQLYDRVMVVVTLLSFVPLVFHNDALWPLMLINVFCALVFIADYILRFITADYRYGERSAWSFIRYPFSPLAIIDLIVILSVATSVNSGFRLLRVARLLHVVRIFQHSRSLQLIKIVLKRAGRPLMFVGAVAAMYIFVVAAIMFNEEPQQFPTFMDAIYWAVTSMATVGYGDIVPATEMGRAITVISTIAGVAVFALPTSVITAEYVAVVDEYREGKIDGKHHPRKFDVDETELIGDALEEDHDKRVEAIKKAEVKIAKMAKAATKTVDGVKGRGAGAATGAVKGRGATAMKGRGAAAEKGRGATAEKK